MFKFSWPKFDKTNKAKELNSQESVVEEHENGGELADEQKEEIKKETKKINPEEELAFLETKKEEINNLYQARQDHYVYAKQLEEKIYKLGLAPEKAAEIKEVLANEGAEISDQIQEIREKYGFEASPEEVYETRFKMLDAEKKRIEKNLFISERSALNYFQTNKKNLDNLHNSPPQFLSKFTHELEKMCPELPVNFLSEDKKAIDQEKLELYEKDLTSWFEKNSLYKNEGETIKALDRLDKIKVLLSDIENRLNKIRSGEER